MTSLDPAELFRLMGSSSASAATAASPSEIDEAFAELARRYESADANFRGEIRALAEGQSGVLWMAAVRCCEAALATKGDEWLLHAVVAHAIEDFRADPRENQLRLALAWFSARELHVDPTTLFETVAGMASERAAANLREFAARSEPSKSLRAMGSEAIVEAGRTRFRPLPPPWRRREKPSVG